MEPTSPACPALQVAFFPLSHQEGPKLNIHLPYDQSDNCTLASTLVSTLEKGNLLFTSKPLQDVSSSSIPDCQTLETSQISFKRWMNKQSVVHPYNGGLFSNKKEKATDILKLLDKLKDIMLSARSQFQKVTQCMFPLTQYSQKDKTVWTNQWLPKVINGGRGYLFRGNARGRGLTWWNCCVSWLQCGYTNQYMC